MKQSLLTILAVVAICSTTFAKEWKSGIPWREPAKVTPGATPQEAPSDAIVLFDGKDLSKWKNGEKWEIKDGAATVKGASISTKEQYGSVQLHIEFASPAEVKGSGQGRGNSGVFFGPYEVQVLDNYDNKTYYDGQCASIYKQSPPLVNACKKPGEWQTYDIIFVSPAWDKEGKIRRDGSLTVLQNGVLVQNHHILLGDTAFNRPPQLKPHGKLSISLQNHGNPVKYRNIWVRELNPDDDRLEKKEEAKKEEKKEAPKK